MTKKYAIDFSNEFVLADHESLNKFLLHDQEDEDEKTLKFHLESDDYFGTLAGILNLVIEDNMISEEKKKEVLKKIRDDLAFLNENYKIVKR